AALRRAAARRHRLWPRSPRPAPLRRRLDPRRHRIPQDRLGRRRAHRGAGAGRRTATARPRPAAPRQAAACGGMSLFGRIRAVFGGRPPGPGATPVYVDEPRVDSWDVVRDFTDVKTARAWHQALKDAGIEAALTVDWPL